MSEEKYEVMVEDGKIVMTDEVANLLKKARALDATIKELTTKRDAIVNAMKDAMNKSGIDKFESDFMKISRSQYSIKDEINVDKLKKDGLYEKYIYHVPSGGTLSVRYPKEKNNE